MLPKAQSYLNTMDNFSIHNFTVDCFEYTQKHVDRRVSETHGRNQVIVEATPSSRVVDNESQGKDLRSFVADKSFVLNR